MILAIDIGNTNIVVGCIDEQETCFVERISTSTDQTTLEYAITFKNILELYHINPKGWRARSSPLWFPIFPTPSAVLWKRSSENPACWSAPV